MTTAQPPLLWTAAAARTTNGWAAHHRAVKRAAAPESDATRRERTRSAAGCTPGHRPPVVAVPGDQPPTLTRRTLIGWWRSGERYHVAVGESWLAARYGYGI